MADLFDVNPGARDPQDAEAIKMGAQRIRTLKTTLQTLLSQIFADNTGTFGSATVPGTVLKVDGTTINTNGSSQLQIKPLLFTSALQTIHADGGATDLTVAHGLAVMPCFIRCVYIPQVTGTGQGVGAVDLGYALLDEVEILCANITIDQSGIGNPFQGYVTSGGTVTFYGYRPTISADATNVYVTIPDGKIFMASKHNSAGVAPTFGVQINKANWKLKVYARTLA